MIKLTEINRAINDYLKASISESETFKNYFDGNPIVSSDISEPIERPSIKINIEGSGGKFNNSCKERSLTVRVYFFAKDRYKYKLDNFKMQELIEETFMEGIFINRDFFIYIDEIDSTVSDTVLICSFDLETLEEIDYDLNLEPLEELNLTLNNCNLTEKEESE